AGQSRTGGPRWTVGETDWGRGRRGKLDFGYFRANGPQVISPGRRPGLTFVIGRGLKGRSLMAQSLANVLLHVVTANRGSMTRSALVSTATSWESWKNWT